MKRGDHVRLIDQVAFPDRRGVLTVELVDREVVAVTGPGIAGRSCFKERDVEPA